MAEFEDNDAVKNQLQMDTFRSFEAITGIIHKPRCERGGIMKYLMDEGKIQEYFHGMRYNRQKRPSANPG